MKIFIKSLLLDASTSHSLSFFKDRFEIQKISTNIFYFIFNAPKLVFFL